MEDIVEGGSTGGEARDVELQHRLELADTWAEVVAGDDTMFLEGVIDRWPGRDYARPLGWIAERRAALEGVMRWEIGPGHPWLELLRESDDAHDPRLAVVDAIALDHDHIDAEQLPRLLRRAHQIVELSLIEADIEPSHGAMFATPWPKLETLVIEDPFNGGCDRIAAAELPALTALILREAPELAAMLSGARWLAQLAWLELDDHVPADVLLALARVPMPKLQHLKLGANVTDEIRDAWRDPELHPALEIIEEETEG